MNDVASVVDFIRRQEASRDFLSKEVARLEKIHGAARRFAVAKKELRRFELENPNDKTKEWDRRFNEVDEAEDNLLAVLLGDDTP